MPTEMPMLSKIRLKELAQLKLKKYRLEEGKVVVEGLRTLIQLREYGIQPLEQYIGVGEKPLWVGVPAYELQEWELGKICASEHSQGLAALFTLPLPRKVDFQRAFYLDGISDPGNLGTIFRVAASFGMEAILLSPDCVEVSSPKVIRASLGSVFQVPFDILEPEQIEETGAAIYATEVKSGASLADFRPPADTKIVIALGSEARGLSGRISNLALGILRIEMQAGMESLNVAVAAGIIAHHLYSLGR